MAPKNKFTKAEMTAAAVMVVRKKGISALTAKSLADELKISTQPVFTCFGTIDNLKKAVRDEAKRIFDSYIDEGLKEKIPFLGYGMKYFKFAKEEPQLYHMLFLESNGNSTLTGMKHAQNMLRPTLMKIYNISKNEADRYFRDVWIASHGLATLLVTGSCPYSDLELQKIMTGFSVSILKSIKEIKGFMQNDFDKDKVFGSLTEK